MKQSLTSLKGDELEYRITAADQLLPALQEALAADTFTDISCPVDYSENAKLTRQLAVRRRPKDVKTIQDQICTAETRPVLETDHLSRVVSGKRLVDDITIGMQKGEVLAVVGPSGSGKSSFLRLLNRLDEPTSGTVYLEGTDYRQIAPRELRRRVGLVTQTPYLFPGSIADNLRFGPLQQGKGLPEETITFLLDQVGLADRANSDVVNLSGGEAQRVSLARAIANSPTVLLMDEPTSALDEEAKEEVEALILKVVRQNALTCVIVSHDLAQAARIASRVMIVKAGRLEKIGSVAEVIHVAGNLH